MVFVVMCLSLLPWIADALNHRMLILIWIDGPMPILPARLEFVSRQLHVAVVHLCGRQRLPTAPVEETRRKENPPMYSIPATRFTQHVGYYSFECCPDDIKPDETAIRNCRVPGAFVCFKATTFLQAVCMQESLRLLRRLVRATQVCLRARDSKSQQLPAVLTRSTLFVAHSYSESTQLLGLTVPSLPLYNP